MKIPKPAEEKENPFEVRKKGGQTIIKVYPRKRGGYVFRYYLGGVGRTVEKVSREKIVAEAERIAGGIDAGLAQTGKLTAADMESYVHAVGQLGPGSPPLHAIVAEWKAAREVLGDAGTLVEAARMWVDRTGAHLGAQKTVSEVVEELIENRHSGRRTYDPGTLRTFTSRLQTFAAAFGGRTITLGREGRKTLKKVEGGRPITSISEKELERFLSKLGSAPRTRHNWRTSIVTLFRFARRRRYLPEDRESEAEKVEPEHWIDPAPTVWTPSELRTVLAHIRPALQPWIVLGAFAGIRTEEICGDRHDMKQEQLQWNDVFWDEREIRIRAEVGKTDEGRMVPISDNLFAWLVQWRGRTGYIVPRRAAYSKATAKLREVENFVINWKPNALRHSHASYQYALDRNLDKLTAAMGNSARSNRKYYQNPQFKRVADEWFGIYPPEERGIIEVNFCPTA